MKSILKDMGEGIMLKDPKSAYESMRSDRLLKVKKFDDAEAIVLGHEEGTGRCEGMMGAVRVKHCVTGVLFKIGSGFTDAHRRDPPKKGKRVTFKHQGVTKANVPRFPIFMRVHPDV